MLFVFAFVYQLGQHSVRLKLDIPGLRLQHQVLLLPQQQQQQQNREGSLVLAGLVGSLPPITNQKEKEKSLPHVH